MDGPRRTSLTRRLLLALVAPMAGLALLLGVGGALMIDNIVERVNDRLLAASVRAISETLSVEDGQLMVDLPPFSLGMLENDSRDNVYYSVRLGARHITGYRDLPVSPVLPLASGETAYSYSTFNNMPIRIAAIARRVPGANTPVVVQVAETLDARTRLRERMMLGLIVLEILLLGLAASILPLAVRWGLAPLARVRRHMESRQPDDFAPLPMHHVPLELGGLITAFNSLLARLDDAVQGMRRFTADASHQMRTPLSILRAHLAVLRVSGTSSDRGRNSLKDIETATDRLQRLLIQLLALARADSAREANGTSFEPVDIIELTRRAAAEHAPSALRANVELIFEHDDAPVEVNTSEGLATELLGNLIDNAIRYNRAGGEVLIQARGTPRGAMVVIEDDGPGIAPSDREAVFTRFRRLERDQSKHGSGLGLAIVRALAETTGATVSLHDRTERSGLRVEVCFGRTAGLRKGGNSPVAA